MPKFSLFTDPQALGDTIHRPEEQCLLLALDLGTTTGYSYVFHKPGKPIPPALAVTLGQLDLSAGPYDSGAVRFVRLRQFLSVFKPDMVAYEDVRYTPAEKLTKYNAGALLARAATACEWFGALKGTLATWCEENGVPCFGVPIGAIKKRATGRGNANKEDMINACNAAFGTDFDTESYHTTGVDNIADAAWVCQLAAEQHANGVVPV